MKNKLLSNRTKKKSRYPSLHRTIKALTSQPFSQQLAPCRFNPLPQYRTHSLRNSSQPPSARPKKNNILGYQKQLSKSKSKSFPNHEIQCQSLGSRCSSPPGVSGQNLSVLRAARTPVSASEFRVVHEGLITKGATSPTFLRCPHINPYIYHTHIHIPSYI